MKKNKPIKPTFPLFPREGNGCPDCGSHNTMHNSWCKIHLGKRGKQC